MFSTTHTNHQASEIAELFAPQGRLGSIDGLAEAGLLMRLSGSIHWELMFTHSTFNTCAMAKQGILLNEISNLIDKGTLRTTMTKKFSPINVVNLKCIHELVETGETRGKLILKRL